MFKHKGYEIKVTPAGRFFAHVQDLDVNEETLAAAQAGIDKIIGNKKRELHLSVVGLRDDKITHDVLLGVNRTSRTLQFESGLILSNVLADTPENVAFLERYQAAEKVRGAMKDRQLHARGYGRIQAGEYEDILREVEAAYQKSAALGKEETE